MITGRKRLDQAVEPGEPAPRLRFASGRLAMSVLLACAALVYFHRARGRLTCSRGLAGPKPPL